MFQKKLFLIILFSLSLRTHSSSIFFMGDSHSVGYFGMKLDKLLRTEFNQVSTVASCGSVAKWFFNGKKQGADTFLEIKMNNGKVVKVKQLPLLKIFFPSFLLRLLLSLWVQITPMHQTSL